MCRWNLERSGVGNAVETEEVSEEVSEEGSGKDVGQYIRVLGRLWNGPKPHLTKPNDTT